MKGSENKIQLLLMCYEWIINILHEQLINNYLSPSTTCIQVQCIESTTWWPWCLLGQCRWHLIPLYFCQFVLATEITASCRCVMQWRVRGVNRVMPPPRYLGAPPTIRDTTYLSGAPQICQGTAKQLGAPPIYWGHHEHHHPVRVTIVPSGAPLACQGHLWPIRGTTGL